MTFRKSKMLRQKTIKTKLLNLYLKFFAFLAFSLIRSSQFAFSPSSERAKLHCPFANSNEAFSVIFFIKKAKADLFYFLPDAFLHFRLAGSHILRL